MNRLLLVPIITVASLLLACSGDDDPTAETPEATASAGATTAPATAPPATSAPASGLPEVNLQRVFPDLEFQRLVGLHELPDGRWLAVEQPGRILLINAAGTQSSLFLDLRGRVDAGGNEEGLLGLALAPDFAQSGVFYLDFTADGPPRTVIARYTANAGFATADAASEEIVLEVSQPFGNHNGGQIAFGPDGYLYIAFGDGGSGNDPMGNGQNLNTLLGKLLRIDVDGGGTYTVPSDNPFVGRQGARGEIWASGLRNPWRFSFDSETGDLWAGDVGQGSREEIDLITRGGNYGWNIMEGNECLDDEDCDEEGLTPPVIDYSSASGNDCSVTGGFVYRGSDVAALRGAYVYADYCSGRIWALRAEGAELSEDALIADADFMISSFAEDNDGEIYVLQHAAAGGVYQIVP